MQEPSYKIEQKKKRDETKGKSVLAIRFWKRFLGVFKPHERAAEARKRNTILAEISNRTRSKGMLSPFGHWFSPHDCTCLRLMAAQGNQKLGHLPKHTPNDYCSCGSGLKGKKCCMRMPTPDQIMQGFLRSAFGKVHV